jgi:hypothetical protein
MPLVHLIEIALVFLENNLSQKVKKLVEMLYTLQQHALVFYIYRNMEYNLPPFEG